MSELINRQIQSAIIVIRDLVQFDVIDIKTNWNLSRQLKYLERAYEKIGDEVKALQQSHFGKDNADDKHPRWREYNDALEKLMEEKTNVEKVFKIKLDGLATKKDSRAVPAQHMTRLEFMISDYEEDAPAPAAT